MAVMCLRPLHSNDHLLCLLGVTLHVLPSGCPDVLGGCSKQTILSLSAREENKSSSLLSQSAYTGRPISPLVEQETLLPSSDGGGGDTERNGIA